MVFYTSRHSWKEALHSHLCLYFFFLLLPLHFSFESSFSGVFIVFFLVFSPCMLLFFLFLYLYLCRKLVHILYIITSTFTFVLSNSILPLSSFCSKSYLLLSCIYPILVFSFLSFSLSLSPNVSLSLSHSLSLSLCPPLPLFPLSLSLSLCLFPSLFALIIF